MRAGRERAARTRRHRPTFVAGAANPVDLADRPGRRPLLRRLRRRHDPPHPLLQRATRPPVAVATREPDERRGAAHRQLRRHRLERPRPGDALTYAWDLDGDGAFDDATAAQPTLHLHRRRARYTARLRVTDAAGASRRATPVDDHGRATRRPTAAIDTPVGGHDLEGRRRRSPSPATRPTRRRARCRRRRSAGRSSCSTARRTATQHPIQTLRRASPAARSRRPTTSTRRTSSCA